MRPSLALVERERNVIDPLFSERAREGRPARTLGEDDKLGAVAAMAEYWLELHPHEDLKQSDKHKTIARLIGGAWLGKIGGSRVKSAREAVNQGATDDTVVRWAKFHREQLEQAAALFGPQQALKIYVDHLNLKAAAPKI